jgi:hypothetical protein
VGLLDQLGGKLLQVLTDLFNRLLGPIFGKLVGKVRDFVSHVANIFTDLNTLWDSVQAEIDAWKNFKEDIRVKSRVINVPKAVEQTKNLVVGLADAWHAILDIIKNFKEKLGTDAKAEAEEAAGDLEESGAEGLLKRLPRLAKGLEKLLGVLTLVVDALASIVDVIGDLQTIVDELKRIREEIESAESIFLQQKNPRKTVKLADGRSIRLRLGKLHS